ncbi:hypothetical protein PTE_01093 [Photorhabdus khanii NC19]|uniref:Uncharacterized protein n=1 Tax=Photorhabdus khanii NC19 TaxID=1004151 RepID=W3V950_9GAMM|nr:hypothetical protein PTE_01093 [Photorhabdus khanii NC19]
MELHNKDNTISSEIIIAQKLLKNSNDLFPLTSLLLHTIDIHYIIITARYLPCREDDINDGNLQYLLSPICILQTKSYQNFICWTHGYG